MKLDPKKVVPPVVPPVQPPVRPSMYAPLRTLPVKGQEPWPFPTGGWAGY